MKKIYTLFMVLAIAFTANAQLVLNENFNSYTNGNLGTQNNWAQPSSGTDVQVASATPLTYTGYGSGSKYITVSSNNGTDPYKVFPNAATIPTNGSRYIYMSFVVRVTSAQDFNGGPDYSIALYNTTNSTVPCRFYIAEHNGASNAIEFGIAVGSSNPSYTTGNFAYNTTYLIVIRYDVVSGVNNDDVYMWVNPSLVTEPSTSTATGATGANQQNTGEVTYGTSLNALKISQSDASDSPDAAYDAFLISNSATSSVAWSLLTAASATLPVNLTSLNVSLDGLNNTKLVWNVASEQGIQSYIVEKSTDGKTFASIGSVAATNQKSYSFTDVQPASDYTYYRLKWEEADGSFKYSYIVSLKSKAGAGITLSPNPVKSNLMIQHPKVTGDAHIQLFNTNGQLIKEFRLSASAVISNVDMSGLANGMYHVVYKSGSAMFSKMVLKQ